MEVTSAAVLLGGTLILYMLSAHVVSQLSSVMKDYLSLSFGIEMNQANVIKLAGGVLYRSFVILSPILLVIMAIGVFSNVAQFGFLFTLKPLRPKAGAFNPIRGLKKLGFSQQAMMGLAKSVFKIVLVGSIGYLTLSKLLQRSIELVDSTPSDILASMGSGAFSIGIQISSAFAVLALIDYYVQRRKFQHDTRMTKQEVKEEHKQDEGDPKIKGRIRGEMIKRHRIRMMANVPKADVVVTNPTHFAIALKYDATTMAAPKVLAKGKDLIAQKIKQVAIEHNIPIVEDKPLAQLLYKTVDVDEEIPPDLFKAVAQILAYIYQMKKLKRGYGSN